MKSIHTLLAALVRGGVDGPFDQYQLLGNKTVAEALAVAHSK
jgi:hypothetical protein